VNSGGFTINNEATTYPPVGKHILDFWPFENNTCNVV
jgi:hypothetical protein